MQVLSTLVMAAVFLVLFLTLYVVTQFDGNAVFPADCAVVFGAAVRGGEYPGPGILRRTNTAARLYSEQKVAKIFLTGGKGSGNAESEAAVMKQVAVEAGVPASVIVMEENSHSTWENIENIRSLVTDCKSIIGISDRYHLARIDFLAWKQGLELDTYPSDGKATLAFEIKNVAREVIGLLFYSFIPERYR